MESHYQIIYTDNMQRDLDKIKDYCYEVNIKNIITKIEQDIQCLTFMPRAYKTLVFVKDPQGEYRRMISGRYSIIYKIEENTIIILRIFNQKQNYLNSTNFVLKEESSQYKIIQ